MCGAVFRDTVYRIVSHNIVFNFPENLRSWKAPADDGGAELTGYVIERKEEDDDFWTTLPDVVSATSHTVKGLKKGKKYKFRVRAENIYGLSDPGETDKSILAKNPYGTQMHFQCFVSHKVV